MTQRRDDPRHSRLHESRAGEGQRGRQARGHLGVWLRALRDADRDARRLPATTSPTRSRKVLRADRLERSSPAETPSRVRRLVARASKGSEATRLPTSARRAWRSEGAMIRAGERATPTRGHLARGGSPSPRSRRLRVSSLAGVAAWILKPAPRKQTPKLDIIWWKPAVQRRQSPVVAVSPDGRHFLRQHDQRALPPANKRAGCSGLPGTEEQGLNSPFFLPPDGQTIAFGVQGQLRRLAVSGGTPVTICVVDGAAFGASWGYDNTILSGLRRGSCASRRRVGRPSSSSRRCPVSN